METIEIETKCTVCNASLVDDTDNGEIICSGCGIVTQEHIADHGPEARNNSLEDKMKLARANWSNIIFSARFGNNHRNFRWIYGF